MTVRIEGFGNNLDENNLNEGVLKKAVDWAATTTKEVADYAGDAVKAAGKDIHDTFLRSKNIKLLLTAIDKAKKKCENTDDKMHYMKSTILINGAGKKRFVTGVTTSGQCIIFKYEDGKEAMTLNDVTAYLKTKGGKNLKIKSDYDSIRMSFDKDSIEKNEKLTYKVITTKNKEQLCIYRGDIESIDYHDDKDHPMFLIKLKKTTQEKHKEAADDIWAL